MPGTHRGDTARRSGCVSVMVLDVDRESPPQQPPARVQVQKRRVEIHADAARSSPRKMVGQGARRSPKPELTSRSTCARSPFAKKRSAACRPCRSHQPSSRQLARGSSNLLLKGFSPPQPLQRRLTVWNIESACHSDVSQQQQPLVAEETPCACFDQPRAIFLKYPSLAPHVRGTTVCVR